MFSQGVGDGPSFLLGVECKVLVVWTFGWQALNGRNVWKWQCFVFKPGGIARTGPRLIQIGFGVKPQNHVDSISDIILVDPPAGLNTKQLHDQTHFQQDAAGTTADVGELLAP